MKALILPFLLLMSVAAQAADPDLDYILRAVRATPCSQVQILIADNIGVIRWEGGSMRYLYGEDIAPLKAAALESGKRAIDPGHALEIPDLSAPGWGAVEDRLVEELNRIFEQDREEHPA